MYLVHSAHLRRVETACPCDSLRARKTNRKSGPIDFRVVQSTRETQLSRAQNDQGPTEICNGKSAGSRPIMITVHTPRGIYSTFNAVPCTIINRRTAAVAVWTPSTLAPSRHVNIMLRFRTRCILSCTKYVGQRCVTHVIFHRCFSN